MDKLNLQINDKLGLILANSDVIKFDIISNDIRNDKLEEFEEALEKNFPDLKIKILNRRRNFSTVAVYKQEPESFESSNFSCSGDSANALDFKIYVQFSFKKIPKSFQYGGNNAYENFDLIKINNGLIDNLEEVDSLDKKGQYLPIINGTCSPADIEKLRERVEEVLMNHPLAKKFVMKVFKVIGHQLDFNRLLKELSSFNEIKEKDKKVIRFFIDNVLDAPELAEYDFQWSNRAHRIMICNLLIQHNESEGSWESEMLDEDERIRILDAFRE